jgi:ApaG protein
MHAPGCPASRAHFIFTVTTRTELLELPGLHVTVDRVIYQPDVQTPPSRPHCFVYFITIHNDSDLTVTIRGRKWVVTNERGEITAVEGDGVVGEFPVIEPGHHFSYNSFHLLNSRQAAAEGSYLGVDDLGRRILTRIPRFEMVVPTSDF